MGIWTHGSGANARCLTAAGPDIDTILKAIVGIEIPISTRLRSGTTPLNGMVVVPMKWVRS